MGFKIVADFDVSAFEAARLSRLLGALCLGSLARRDHPLLGKLFRCRPLGLELVGKALRHRRRFRGTLGWRFNRCGSGLNRCCGGRLRLRHARRHGRRRSWRHRRRLGHGLNGFGDAALRLTGSHLAS